MFSFYQMYREERSQRAALRAALPEPAVLRRRPAGGGGRPGLGAGFLRRTDYVEEHGIQVCGALVYAEAPDLVQMWESGDIDGISIATVLPSRYSAEGGQYSW